MLLKTEDVQEAVCNYNAQEWGKPPMTKLELDYWRKVLQLDLSRVLGKENHAEGLEVPVHLTQAAESQQQAQP